MSEFSWWLLIVGLVIGAGLVWLVLADSNRREADVTDRELPLEAAWIASELADGGLRADPSTVEEVLRLHRAYLAAPPPDNIPPLAPRPAPASDPDDGLPADGSGEPG